jgi:hypothetical protein
MVDSVAKPRRYSGDAINVPNPLRLAADEQAAEALINAIGTSAFLVFEDEQVRHEAYFLTGGTEVRWTSCFAIAGAYQPCRRRHYRIF